MSPAWPWLILSATAGLALGSYAITAGIRFARGEPSTAGRSRCDACGEGLGFAQTTPLLSYALLGGACSACRAPIDRLHLVGEIAGGAVLLAAASLGQPGSGVLVAALGLVLVTLGAIDSKLQRLPDRFTVTVALLAAALSLLASPAALLTGLGWSAGLVAALLAVRAASQGLLGKAGLGLGDVKLMGALALWLGPATPWMVALAALLGLAVMAISRPADGRLPFGPMIGLAGFAIGVIREAGWWPTML